MQTDVFIWDEAQMSPRYALEIMDRTLRDVINNNLLFGGKIDILGGDFRQLLPLIPRGIRSEIINLSIKSSILWNTFYKFKLTHNMRAINEDITFFKFVLDVKNGDLNDDKDNIIIPQRCLTTESNFVSRMYKYFMNHNLFHEMSCICITCI